jgi:hypothetical protein
MILELSEIQVKASLEGSGGLFDFDGTLPVMVIQILLLVVLLESKLYNPVSKFLKERKENIAINIRETSKVDLISAIHNDFWLQRNLKNLRTTSTKVDALKCTRQHYEDCWVGQYTPEVANYRESFVLSELTAANDTRATTTEYYRSFLSAGSVIFQLTTPGIHQTRDFRALDASEMINRDMRDFQTAFAASDMHHDMREIVANDIFDLKDPKPKPSFSI